MKRVSLLLGMLVIVILSLSVVNVMSQRNVDSAGEMTLSGGETNFERVGNNIAEWVSGIFGNVGLAPENSSRILLGILLWMVLYSVVINVGLFKDLEPKFLWTGGIALIITILAFIALPGDFIKSLETPFGALGGTILTMIPFIIMIYFTVWVTENLFVAKAIWVVYIIYYFSLFIYELVEVGVSTAKEDLSLMAPYIFGISIGIIIFVMLGKLRFWLHKGKIQAIEEKATRKIDKAGKGVKVWGDALESAAGEDI